jgi:hypothetical protein
MTNRICACLVTPLYPQTLALTSPTSELKPRSWFGMLCRSHWTIRLWVWKGLSTSLPVSRRTKNLTRARCCHIDFSQKNFPETKILRSDPVWCVLYILKLHECFVMLIYYCYIHLRSKFSFITAEPDDKVNIISNYWGWPSESKISFYQECGAWKLNFVTFLICGAGFTHLRPTLFEYTLPAVTSTEIYIKG